MFFVKFFAVQHVRTTNIADLFNTTDGDFFHSVKFN